MRNTQTSKSIIHGVVSVLALVVLLAVPAAAAFAGGSQETAPPALEIPPQQRQFISPANQDGVQDVLQLPFSTAVVPAENMVIIEYALTIFDADGNPVYVQRERQTERRGFFGNIFGGEKPQVQIPDTLQWDGRNQDGEFVEDGEYTYQLSVMDDARNISLSPPFAVTVDNTPPVIEEFPPLEYRIFAPNGDGVRDDISIGLRGSRELRWVVEILDSSDEAVFTATFENPTPRRAALDPAPPTVFVWDGTVGTPDDQDRPVAPEGQYRISLSGFDRAGNSATEIHPETITLSLQESDVALRAADGNNAFSPNDSGRRDTITLDVVVTERDLVDTWTLEILSRGQVVRSESGRGVPPAQWVFDGGRQDGSTLPDGTVQARFRTRLINGITSESAPLELVIDTQAPRADFTARTEPAPTESGRPLVFGAGDKEALAGTIRFDRDVEWFFRLSLDGVLLADGALEEFLDLVGTVPAPVAGQPHREEVALTWHGQALVDQGSAPDGLYELVLTAEDRAGNVGTSQPLRVILDSRTPDITLTVDGRYISPLTRSPMSELVFRATYGAPERIEEFLFEIRDARDRVVRSEYRRQPFETFRWNGLTNGGTIVPDGEYTARLQVIWQNGHRALVEGVGPVIADRTAPRIEALALNRRQFAPEADDGTDTVTITQRVVPGDTWTGEMRNAAGEVIFRRQFRDAEQTIVWDGRTPAGTVVPDGEYRYVLSAEDAAGNRTEESLIVLVDSRPFIAEVNLTVTPQMFSPDGDGIDDRVRIGIEVVSRNPITRWEMQIMDPRNRPFRRFTGTGAPPAQIVWDGLSNTGELVQSAMDYPVRMTVRDNRGEETVGEASISTDILVMRDGDRLRIRISSINFAGNTADMFLSDRTQLENNLSTLRRLAQILERFPNDDITIEGHAAHVYLQSAESIAREQRDELLPLSRARAEEVMKALMILGIDRDRMSIEAFGGLRPVVPHDNEEERWKNRRVEFLLNRRGQ